MQSDASSARPAIPERERAERGLRLGIIASVLLHAGLVLVVARAVTMPLPSTEEAARPSLQVSIVTRSPRREPQPDEPADARVAPPDESPSEASVMESAGIPPPRIETPTQEQEASLADNPGSTLPTIDDETSAATLDIGRLRDSIRGTLGLHRSDTLDQQMDACRQYRERYARRDCPKANETRTAAQDAIDTQMQATFRAWTYGHSENARIVREMEADMNALRPLMADPGVLGEVARTHYYLKAVQHEVMAPPGSNDGTVTILTLTPGGLVILNGWMTIGFDGKVKDKAPARDFGYEE